ncbi:GNAT family N-acetyltransferase [candidate division KSB1 bacterium]|nr:GNAT family N-acetyltransferase [candidate division KSB1 bacterium]
METAVQDLFLRQAQEEDVPLLLDFIKQLADYEKLSHVVVADAESLRRTLFGEIAFAEVILADYQNQSVGFALFFHNYSTFLGKPGIYLEDLFVVPAMRGKGIGRELLKYLARLTKERNCGRLEWSVLDWNKPAIEFYKNMGAVPMEQWTVFRLTGKALERLSGSA